MLLHAQAAHDLKHFLFSSVSINNPGKHSPRTYQSCTKDSRRSFSSMLEYRCSGECRFQTREQSFLECYPLLLAASAKNTDISSKVAEKFLLRIETFCEVCLELSCRIPLHKEHSADAQNPPYLEGQGYVRE